MSANSSTGKNSFYFYKTVSWKRILVFLVMSGYETLVKFSHTELVEQFNAK